MLWNRSPMNSAVELSSPVLYSSQNVRVLDDHGLYYYGVKKEASLQCPNDRVRHRIAWEMCCCAAVCAEDEWETCRVLE